MGYSNALIEAHDVTNSPRTINKTQTPKHDVILYIYASNLTLAPAISRDSVGLSGGDIDSHTHTFGLSTTNRTLKQCASYLIVFRVYGSFRTIYTPSAEDSI